MKKEESEIAHKAYELLKYVGIEDVVDEEAINLSYGHQRRLEIARALACEPKLLAFGRTRSRHEPFRNRRLEALDEQNP